MMNRKDELEINELVKKAQESGSREERESLVLEIQCKLKPFRFALAKRFANKGVDFGDIVQQIELTLIEAIYDYDETKDPSALRHLTSKTRNGIWNFYRKEMNYFDDTKKTVSLDHLTDDANTNKSFSRYDIDMSLTDNNFSENDIVERLVIEDELEKLTPHQREVLMMYFIDDKTQYSIAEELNINQANVSRAKKRAIKQLQDNILEEDDINPLDVLSDMFEPND